LGSAFAASSVQHISDVHSKFSLEPHHVQALRLGKEKKKKKERKKKETTEQKYNGLPHSIGRP